MSGLIPRQFGSEKIKVPSPDKVSLLWEKVAHLDELHIEQKGMGFKLIPHLFAAK